MPEKLSSDGLAKFGSNPDIDIGTAEDVWDGGAIYAFPTQARVHTIVSTDAADIGVAIGTLTLLSAIATDIAIVNGLTYTAVAGVPANFTEFSIDTSDTAAAASLAAAINGDTRPGVTVPTAVVVATSAVGVVTIAVDGPIGNLVDISSPDATITASAATLADVGTGAQSILIEGLGSDYLELTETVFLRGTTGIPTLNSYLRINRVTVMSAGSGGANAGILTATAVTDATVTAQIAIGNNQTTQAIFTVPADRDFMLTDYYVSVGKTTPASVDGKLLIRPFGETFQLHHTLPAVSQGDSEGIHRFNPNHFVGAKSDIKIQASSTANNTLVYGGFNGLFSRPPNA